MHVMVEFFAFVLSGRRRDTNSARTWNAKQCHAVDHVRKVRVCCQSWMSMGMGWL